MRRIRQNAIELLRHALVSLLVAAMSVGPASLALAGPQNPVVVRGNVTFEHADGSNVWTIKAPNGSIIRYSGLDILSGETVVFQQGSSSARVLNRISSAQPTRIDGTLSADGIVYIVNPAGVYFGDTARVNVAGLQAAAGNLSNRDFLNEDDHYTGLKGKVENRGEIGVVDADHPDVTNAVALVGRNVVNSGTIDGKSWIVLAAGKDVFIGRDEGGNGLLLRIEGGRDAVFKKAAVGVKNTGTLAAGPADPNGQLPASQRISLGAGDLYGTAIFNSGAIRAREIALQADNKGDIDLRGKEHADSTLDITFAGDKPGKLVTAGTTHELTAHTLNLTATGAKGKLDVAGQFRLNDPNAPDPNDPNAAPTEVNISQTAQLATTSVANLSVARRPENVALRLKSATGIDIDDRRIVNGTRLTVDAPSTTVHGESDLAVDRLDAQSRLFTSEANVIANGKDEQIQTTDPNAPIDWVPVLDFNGNVQMTTRVRDPNQPVPPLKLSAVNGTIRSTGDVITTDGGGLVLEAADVELGEKRDDGTLRGGSLLSSGTVAGSVAIRAELPKDPNGLPVTDGHLTGSVRVNAIFTRAAELAPGVDQLGGGDVVITADKDVTVQSDISTEGGAGKRVNDPRRDGGDVLIDAGGTATVHSIATGGGDSKGKISISGSEVVLRGNLSTVAGDTGNTSGERNREIEINGDQITLGTDSVRVSGGHVRANGPIAGELILADPNVTDPNDPNSKDHARAAGLGFESTELELLGPVTVKSLAIRNTGTGPVTFAGDVTADDLVDVNFVTQGEGHWATSDPDGVIVKADQISVRAGPAAGTGDATQGSVRIDDGIQFALTQPSDGVTRPIFVLSQAGAIDENTTDMLFTEGRFAPAVSGGNTIELLTNSSMTLASSAVLGPDSTTTDLVLAASTFNADPGALFDVGSFQLTTSLGLDTDINVIAHGTRDDQRIDILSGSAGQGSLTVRGKLQGREILLAAGDGLGVDGADGGSGSTVTVACAAPPCFGNAAGTGRPDIFGIAQDADLQVGATTGAPGKDQFFGGSIEGMEYRLESRQGATSLGAGAAGLLQGTNLVLNGESGLNLGLEALTLSGLSARTGVGMGVFTPITVSGTDGKIELRAGESGSGNLDIGTTLKADDIELHAGSGTGATSSVGIQSGPNAAHLVGSGGGAPKRFAMIQDASLSDGITTLADFGDGSLSNLKDMKLELGSLGGVLELVNPALADQTALTLQGKGITLPLAGSTLHLVSLDATGQLTVDGSVQTDHDLAVNGAVILDGGATQSLVAGVAGVTGGALTITGATKKNTEGDITLAANRGREDPNDANSPEVGGELTVGDVATNLTGGRIAIAATDELKTGALVASGQNASEDPNARAVKVVGGGEVEIARIDARGATGASTEAGKRGGNVEVSGTNLRVGTIDTSGGRGGATTNAVRRTNGGDAGSIALTATGSGSGIGVGITGDLLAVGGEGVARDAGEALGPLRGQGNAVDVNGDLLLDLDRGDGPGNAIRGQTVAISGAVSNGTKLDADGNATIIPAANTSLTVVAENDPNGPPPSDPNAPLSIGGSITTGELDLELHHGDLDLGPKTITADTIRLAATDGKGGDSDGEVENVDQLTFVGAVPNPDPNSPGPLRIQSLTIEQDKGFGGANGSLIPNANDKSQFQGVDGPLPLALELGLVSQDGNIVLAPEDYHKVEVTPENPNGTRLILAANGPPPADPNAPVPPEARPIQIGGAGANLVLQSLQLGSATGVGLGIGDIVGGDARVTGNLTVGKTGLSADALRQYGDLTVTGGNAHVLGLLRFTGPKTQTLEVLDDPGVENDGVLDFSGAAASKTTTGDLKLFASRIDLTAAEAQSISNESGQLEIGAPLVKGKFQDTNGDGIPEPQPDFVTDPNDPDQPVRVVGQRSLSLFGVSDGSRPGVIVEGTTKLTPDDPNGPPLPEYAIAVSNGDLLIDAGNSSNSSAPGQYQLGGGLLVFGDARLLGEGAFTGHPAGYTIEARRNPGTQSGELTMGGIASADGDVRLVARGDDPSVDVPRPAAIHLLGNFGGLAGSLELDGSVDFSEDTSIDAAGDVLFDARVQGDKGLSVKSGGNLALFDDVVMDGSSLSLSGDQGVQFLSTSDTQFVEAANISLGSGASRAPSGAATLTRDGNLSLKATGGDVAIARGQRMVVNGSLDVTAPRQIALADTAALRISLVSHDLIVQSGASIVGNSIVAAARPVPTSGGVATFAVPTRTELSDNIPSDQILVRQIHPDGSPLSLDAAFAGVENGEALFAPIPFPSVQGPALFDYASLLPLPPLRYAINRPHVDVRELDAALLERPLWAEELLAYLQERSLEAPDVSESVERLPPVGARPGDPLVQNDRRVRSAAAEQAVALYRELFRPDVARDPETGIVESAGQAAAIRAAFQAPIDALRRGNGGKPVSGAALRDLIASDPSFARAQSYGSQLDQLLAAGELALTPDQKPRFRELVLSEVTPYGIAPTEFGTAIQ